jgi:hypothetical protein
MKQEKYTEMFHAKRVRLMLSNSDNPCGGCPADRKPLEECDLGDPIPGIRRNPTAIFQSRPSDECCVCQSFFGVPIGSGCPCKILGDKETVKRARKKLKKMSLI